MREVVLTLDTGMNTAVAVWDHQSWVRGNFRTGLMDVHTFSPPKKCNTLVNRLYYLQKRLDHLCGFVEPDIVTAFVEFPEFYQSRGGQVSAADGALVRLASVVGMTVNVVSRYAKDTFIVTPSQWKGQLPKDISHDRLQKQLAGSRTFEVMARSNKHAWDAIGIGVALMETPGLQFSLEGGKRNGA